MTTRETEAKLAAPAEFSMPSLDDVAAGVRAEPLPFERLTATYYDTEDLRLARSGVTVRYRTSDRGGGWTVKLPEGVDGPALVRRELNFDGPSGVVPPTVADLVRAHARSSPLAAMARLRTDRSGWSLRTSEGERLADVVDDAVSVYEGRRIAGRFREVEVELLDGDGRRTKLLDTVVSRLVEAGCTDEPAIPKVVRALGHRAAQPPDVVVGRPGDKASAADLIGAAIAASVDRLIRHDPGVRVGDDAEDVHQARVATRRLRSDLQTFASLLDDEWVAEVSDELRWIGDGLGGVRDADVLTERLRAQSHSLPDRDASGLSAVLLRLAQQRNEARRQLLDALASERYVLLLEQLVRAAQAPPAVPLAHDARASEVAPALVARPWRRLAKAASELGSRPADADLHRVRIRAKRTRYAAEAVAPVVGKVARRLAAAVAEVQTALGDHQDAVVAEAWLRDAASAMPVAALACGELIALQRDDAERARAAWRPVWKAASAKKLRSWM